MHIVISNNYPVISLSYHSKEFFDRFHTLFVPEAVDNCSVLGKEIFGTVNVAGVMMQ